ncbi:MAG: DNA replication and repair protein RecF [Bifidobacteriaceae bacterium]|jgi:DNA replication and repair protein RecF|nr:DNA replication and repair protein RecF [Bifidobacteriaceae bacterium]MCI1978522.1 DNA replication and repair protein RecF [Bifidobacteriaceae bacterium]
MTFRIDRLALDHFRSWSQTVLDFSPGINVLVGKNGIGKTNIVEAIEFLATGASHRASASKYLVQRGETKATVRANVFHRTNSAEIESLKTIEVTIPQRGAIRSRIDSGPSRYFRDIAGTVKAVLFSPRDQQLVSGNPADRRSFLDSAATMMFPDYYSLLQRFRQIAKQRTAVLKRIADFTPQQRASNQGMSMTELEVWTSQFIDVGIEITQRRQRVVTDLSVPFTRIYNELAHGEGFATLHYVPSFAEVVSVKEPQSVTDTDTEAAMMDVSNSIDERSTTEINLSETDKKLVHDSIKQGIAEHFQRLYPGEVARGVNLIGPHRDDLLVSLDGEPAQEFASNGELWTLGLALKMAQFDYVANDDTPVLILDDVFAQLDESRRQQILAFAAHQQQVFITVAAHSDIPPVGKINIIDVEAVAAKMSEGGALEADVRNLLGRKSSENSKNKNKEKSSEERDDGDFPDAATSRGEGEQQ